MKIVVRNGGIPWWVFVGGIGFLLFGGWKGFFGAIAGVILIPIALVFTFALGFFFWSLFLSRKFGKQSRPSPFEFERREQAPGQPGDVIITESVVVKSETESER
ncbi:MAG: hypothetical protein ACLGG7_02785 [Bacteriovoracia bacterium]